jgi:hypothetical protein
VLEKCSGSIKNEKSAAKKFDKFAWNGRKKIQFRTQHDMKRMNS